MIVFCFFKANRLEALAIKQILHKYELASGQLVNFQKSALAVSPGTKSEDVKEVKDVLQMLLVSCHVRYLGMPSMINRNRKHVFKNIKEKVEKKVARWQEKLFSKGEKEILIKSVI